MPYYKIITTNGYRLWRSAENIIQLLEKINKKGIERREFFGRSDKNIPEKQKRRIKPGAYKKITKRRMLTITEISQEEFLKAKKGKIKRKKSW